MRLDGAKKWYAAAALASVLVLVTGWFLLVSPQRQSADDIAAQADSQVAANVSTQAKIDALKAQYTNLPTLQKQLALVQTHLPQTPGMPSLIRNLSQAATASGVKLLTVTPATPSPLVTSAAPTSPTGTSALAAPGQVNVIPVTLNVVGPFANTRLFLSSLESMPRSFLVTGLTIVRGKGGAGTGTTSGAPGGLTTTVTGRVFTANPGLPAAAAASTTSTSGTAASTATNG
jgi:Tfp pilus assembly protein PilO